MSTILNHSILLTSHGRPRRGILIVFPMCQWVGWNKNFVHLATRKQNSLEVFLWLWAENLVLWAKKALKTEGSFQHLKRSKVGLESYFLVQADTGRRLRKQSRNWGSYLGHINSTQNKDSLEWGTEQLQNLRKRECLGSGLGGGTALRPPTHHDPGNPD